MFKDSHNRTPGHVAELTDRLRRLSLSTFKKHRASTDMRPTVQVAELAEAVDEELLALGLKRVEIKRLRKALPPGAPPP